MSEIDPHRLRKLYYDRRITREQYVRGLSVTDDKHAFSVAGPVGLVVNILSRRRTKKLLRKMETA